MEIAPVLQGHDLPGWTIHSAGGKWPPPQARPWPLCWRRRVSQPSLSLPFKRLLCYWGGRQEASKCTTLTSRKIIFWKVIEEMQSRKCLHDTDGIREGSLTGKRNSEKVTTEEEGNWRQKEDGSTVLSHCLAWVFLFYDIYLQGAPVNSRKTKQRKDGFHSFYLVILTYSNCNHFDSVFSRLLQTSQV